MSDLVCCRYNPNHKVKKSRLTIHEYKCPDKNNSKVVVCPFDPNEKINVKDYDNHVRKHQPKIDNNLKEAIQNYIRENKQDNHKLLQEIRFQELKGNLVEKKPNIVGIDNKKKKKKNKKNNLNDKENINNNNQTKNVEECDEKLTKSQNYDYLKIKNKRKIKKKFDYLSNDNFQNFEKDIIYQPNNVNFKGLNFIQSNQKELKQNNEFCSQLNEDCFNISISTNKKDLSQNNELFDLTEDDFKSIHGAYHNNIEDDQNNDFYSQLSESEDNIDDNNYNPNLEDYKLDFQSQNILIEDIIV